MVPVGVERPVVPVDADLNLVLADDTDVAVLHFKLAADENLRHPWLPLSVQQCSEAAL
jgi:hypothetical protein